MADISKKSEGMKFNSTKQDIIEALNSSANTAAGPDSIAFSMIKKIASHIVYLLIIIFQHSLAQGIFPLLWKRAYIIPSYKRKGDRTVATSYRPISLCSCLGKLIDRIVK